MVTGEEHKVQSEVQKVALSVGGGGREGGGGRTLAPALAAQVWSQHPPKAKLASSSERGGLISLRIPASCILQQFLLGVPQIVLIFFLTATRTTTCETPGFDCNSS